MLSSLSAYHIIHQNELAEVSVVFWDDVGYTGAAYSPDGLVQAVCNTLPGDWLDRPESLQIDAGFQCTFFTSVPVSFDDFLVSYN
jgi:hypothetical protein